MNLLTGESLTICVDPELFVPAKEVYLNLMSLVTPQTLVHLKLYSKKIQSFLGMYLDNFRWMSSKMTPKHAWNFDKISPAKNFSHYFCTLSFLLAEKTNWKILFCLGFKFETNHRDFLFLLNQWKHSDSVSQRTMIVMRLLFLLLSIRWVFNLMLRGLSLIC